METQMQNWAEEFWAAKRKTAIQEHTVRDQMCPDCRQPNRLTRSERRASLHCEACTEQCRAMMATPAAHVTFTV